MKKKRRWMTSVLLLVLTLALALPVSAGASYRTVTSEKTKYGNYYVWRSENASFSIQKVDSEKVKTLSRNVYTVGGTTNGTQLYYTTLAGKHSGKVNLYRYTLKTGKTKKIGTIKNALHIVYGRNGCVYGNGAKDGKASNKVYQYNLKTKKKTTLIRNFWVDYGKGKYLYGTRDGVKYRYNLSTKKLSKYNYTSIL